MIAAIPSKKVARAALSKQEAQAYKAQSDLKQTSLVQTNFVLATPDFLEVPADDVHGLAIDFLQIISLNSTAYLRVRLQRPGFMEQPTNVTGVTVLGVSGGRAGDGTLAYVAAGTLLSWQEPGAGAAGAAVNVGAGGIFELAGGGSQTLRVSVVAAGLPVGNQTDVLTVNEVDDLVNLTLVPVNSDIFLPFTTPYLIANNVRTVFEVIGLGAGDDYSIFVSCYRWRPALPWGLTHVGV